MTEYEQHIRVFKLMYDDLYENINLLKMES